MYLESKFAYSSTKLNGCFINLSFIYFSEMYVETQSCSSFDKGMIYSLFNEKNSFALSIYIP